MDSREREVVGGEEEVSASEESGNSDSKGSTEPRFSESIFTPEEITSLLKGFINAWLKGKVKISFNGAQDFVEEAKLKGHQLSPDEADKLEIEQYTRIERVMGIVLGTLLSTKEERTKATSELTRFIIRYRAIERLNGEFDTFDSELKLQELIEKVDALGTAFQGFVDWLRGL